MGFLIVPWAASWALGLGGVALSVLLLSGSLHI